MRDQLLRLIELSRLSHVTIRIVPFDESRAAFSHSCMAIVPSVTHLGTVLVDQLGTSHFLGRPEEITGYARSFDKLSALALPPVDAEAVPETRTAKDSLGLIQHILYPLL